jgi:hypothetical protein
MELVMDDRECIVCSEDVSIERDFRASNAGGNFDFAFCDQEVPIKLWIHHHCLQYVEATGASNRYED